MLSNCLLFFSINSFNWFIFTVFDLSIVVQCVHRTVFGGYRFAPDILQSWKSSAFARLQCSTLQFNGSGRMDQFTISVGPVRFLSVGKKQSAPTPATQAKKCLNIREIKKVALAYTGTDPYLGTPLKSGSCGIFSRSSLPIFY